MADPTLASNNPFRRKPTIPIPQSPGDVPASPQAAAGEVASPASLSAQPTGDDFRRALTALPKSSEAPPSTTFQRPKPVKKVRVQSPPPSSPDSTDADFEARFPAAGPSETNYQEPDSSSSSSSDSGDETELGDPFHHTVPRGTTALTTGPSPVPPNAARQPPHNPFNKTLEDLEHSSKAGAHDAAQASAAAAGKGGLDVSAFQRLLMTGQAGPNVAPPASPSAHGHLGQHHIHPAGDAGSITDASSISKQSIFEASQNPQETPRTSHEISEAEDDRRGLLHAPFAPTERTTLRKKPPPPSSRHGKLIKPQPKVDSVEQSRESTPRPAAPDSPMSPSSETTPGDRIANRRTSSSSDLNKPLPLPPQRISTDAERESVFDREAAGKVPEVDIDPDAPEEEIPPPRPPTPPNASHSASTPTATPSVKPPPPPRRHAHPKAESRPGATPTATPGSSSLSHATDAAADATPPRSSMDSSHSRSSSLKGNSGAPPPPPPPARRPNHVSRPSNSFVSPSVTSFASSLSELDSRSQLGLPTPTSHAQSHGGGPTTPPASQPNGPPPESLSSPSQARPARPPPPPARHVSTRHKEQRNAETMSLPGRPPSVISVEASTPPAHRTGAPPPPPPPRPRQRGSSRGSTEAPSVDRRKSVDSVHSTHRAGEEPGHHMAALTEEQSGGGPSEGRRDSAPNDILADLDRLRKEVDALRGAL